MPLTVRDGALVGAGMLFASGATIFYKRKQTLPFKARQGDGTLLASANARFYEVIICALQLAYFAAWPTLGTAILFAAMPRNERLVAVS